MGIFSHHKIYNSCTYETLIKKIHDDRKLYIYSVMLLNKFTCESEYYIVLKDSGIYGKRSSLSIFAKFKVWWLHTYSRSLAITAPGSPNFDCWVPRAQDEEISASGIMPRGKKNPRG